MKFLSDKTANDMLCAISDLMHNQHNDPQGADYRCEFCQERPPTNQGNITHRGDCDGMRFKQALENSESADLSWEKAPVPAAGTWPRDPAVVVRMPIHLDAKVLAEAIKVTRKILKGES